MVAIHAAAGEVPGGDVSVAQIWDLVREGAPTGFRACGARVTALYGGSSALTASSKDSGARLIGFAGDSRPRAAARVGFLTPS